MPGVCTTVWQTLMRRKRVDAVTSLETRLKRCASTLDLTFFGLGNMLGSSVYVVTGNLVRIKAGPAACVSYMIAGFAALLSALCYAELGSRFPQAGSAYTYTYVAVGEFVAFVIGWSVICEYVIGTSTVAKGWSDTLDSLFDYAISNWTNAHLPFRVGGSRSSAILQHSPGPVQLSWKYPEPSAYVWLYENSTNFTTAWPPTTTDSGDSSPRSWFDQSPDLASFGITVLFIAVLCAGAKSSLRFNNVTNAISLTSLAVVCIVMFIYGNLDNLSHPDGFAPFGVGGVIRGSAVAFYAYIGFDAVAVAAEEVRDPSRTVPRASAYCIIIVSAVMLISTLALVLYIPYDQTSSTAAFTDALHSRGLEWAELVCGIGGLIGMTAAMLCSVFALPRVVYAMANDGLLFRWLGNVAECSRVPVISTILFGLLAAVCALVFDFDVLADFLSIGTLIAYTIVSANVVALRFTRSPGEGASNHASLNHEPPSVPTGSTLHSDDADAFVNQVDPRRDQLSDSNRLAPDAARNTYETSSAYGSLEVAIVNASRTTSSDSDKEVLRRVGMLKPCFAASSLVPEWIKNAPPSRVPILALLIYVISTTCCCVLIVVASSNGVSDVFPFVPIYFVVPLVFSFVVMVFSVCVMCAYERCDAAIHTFRVPFVPLVPCVSIAVNVVLIANLNPLTWVRFGAWLALGLVIYFGYGVRHSTEARRNSYTRLDNDSFNESSHFISTSPPATQNFNPIA